MHHKRGRPKNRRSGCLMCKPNKQNGWAKNRNLGHAGFGKIRREIAAQSDLKEILNETKTVGPSQFHCGGGQNETRWLSRKNKESHASRGKDVFAAGV